MTRRPSPGNIGDGFGWRYHPIAHEWRHHDGEDIGWANGTTLVAPLDAQLVSYANSGGWGRLATLRAGNTTIRLAHTEKLWPGVDVGEWLDEGQPIAVMGDTGLAAGVHVHWEVLIDGRLVDPAAWLASTAGGGSKPLPTPKPPTPATPEKEEEDMAKNSAFRYQRATDKRMVNLIVNTSVGWWFEYLDTAVVNGNNPVAATLDTGSYAEVKESFAKALKTSLPRAQGVVVSGALTVAGEEEVG